MPIRFRCAYCNQLLGIARRKAGTVVKCPTCAGQVVVPNIEGDDDRPKAPGDQPVFERSDFDDLFNFGGQAGEPRTGGAAVEAPAAPAAAPAAAPPAGAWGTNADPAVALDVPRGGMAGVAALGSRQPGIILSPAKATLLTVIGVVALAVAFGAGLLVGWWLFR
jgi:hypothetical protein